MAKQRGIHQLKGKVGGMSYYQQAGVQQGLVRRIPEGLSSRVKTADEYANTRLNNDEFKNANWIATFLFNAVPSRKASMMRRFAIGAMTKRALEYIKAGSGNWGQRIPVAKLDEIAVDLLDNQSKSGPYSGEFGVITFSRGENGAITVLLEYDAVTASSLQEKGIDGFYIVHNKGAMAEVIDSDGFVRQHFGVSTPEPTDVTIESSGGSSDFSFTPSPREVGLSPAGYTVAQGAPNNGMFTVLTFLPYRSIGSQRYTLYEYATFAVVALGSIPTA